MTRRTVNATRTSRRTTPERAIDEMVEQTFPASDATQLPGRAAGAPATRAKKPLGREETPKEFTPGTPRTIGNQGVVPASRMLEETLPLTDVGAVTLRFDTELRRLLIYLSEEGMPLDATALDRLIAVLSAKRALLNE
jgi:hypothetical protein